MYLTLCLDDQWVKNALTPLSESSQIATMWLQKYFDAYGDKSPTEKGRTKLAITFRHEVYQQYVNEMTIAGRGAEGPEFKIVSHNKFLELWRVIYPECTDRPGCSIPGKCLFFFKFAQTERM
jgi:hypothetical protein